MVFPSYHPRAGQRTYFVESIMKCLYTNKDAGMEEPDGIDFDLGMFIEGKIKHHTIRAGHRWKAGDKFSPRVWSGKPYASKQIQFAPDIEVKKVWSFSIGLAAVYIDQQRWIDKSFIKKVSENDGLEMQDFLDWFQYPKPFNGEIICWSDSIEYVNDKNQYTETEKFLKLKEEYLRNDDEWEKKEEKK